MCRQYFIGRGQERLGLRPQTTITPQILEFFSEFREPYSIGGTNYKYWTWFRSIVLLIGIMLNHDPSIACDSVPSIIVAPHVRGSSVTLISTFPPVRFVADGRTQYWHRCGHDAGRFHVPDRHADPRPLSTTQTSGRRRALLVAHV